MNSGNGAILTSLLLWLALPTIAMAGFIDYEIQFSGSGELPTSGSFRYDDTGDGTFSDFIVEFGGVTFDLTTSANSPIVGGANFGCGFSQNAAGSFEFLTMAGVGCSFFYGWEGDVDPPTASFRFQTTEDSGLDGIFTVFGEVVGQVSGDAAEGTGEEWEVVRSASVPEVETLALISIGLAGLGLRRRKRELTII